MYIYIYIYIYICIEGRWTYSKSSTQALNTSISNDLSLLGLVQHKYIYIYVYICIPA